MRKWVCLFFSIVLILPMIACHPLGKKRNYLEAKDETTGFFNKHKDRFLSAVNEIEKSHSADNIKISGIESIWYDEEESNVTVTFYKQGYGLMIGGQYWGVYYSANGKPFTNWNVKLVSGPYEGCFYWQEDDGSNTYVTEHLEDGWYFYYEDYDGNGHGLNWECLKQMRVEQRGGTG